MILKFVTLLVLCSSNISGAKLEYTYNDIAGGWLKMHVKPETRNDAWAICAMEGAVLASPLNIEVRNGIKSYISNVASSITEIFAGVHADLSEGDFISPEGVPLSKMPVSLTVGAPINYDSSESCIAWKNRNDKVRNVNCNDKLPFVCHMKRKTQVVARCGNHDLGYTYEPRTDSCYKFEPKGLVWLDAFKKCKNEGGYLAVINNDLENEVLNEIFAKHPSSSLKTEDNDYAVIGFRDFLDEESWRTVNGKSLADEGFDKWASGEPNNIGVENCGSIYRKGNLNNLSCSKKYAFICEKKPEYLYV